MATAIPAWAQDTPKEEIPAWASAPAPQATPSWATAQPGGTPDKRRAYLQETDRLLGLPPGTSEKQIQAESAFNPQAVSKKGAQGLAQVMPETKANLEKQLGRKLDSFNEDDALLMHREVMRQNMQKFGNTADALRAYNAGWDPKRWNNPETINYVAKITGEGGASPYTNFAPVRKDIDPKSLNSDTDWLRASLLMYSLWERKPFQGSENDLAEWGKDFMGYFNYNMVDMARQAYAVTQGASQQEKEAFLYMMDTYDNTNISWEGTGRAFKGILTDPTNLVGLGTLGVGFAGKFIGKQTAKQGLKAALQQGLARTGIAAGVEGAVFAGTDSAVRQGVEVSAGRRESIDLSKIGLDSTIGATAGVVLGTAADAAVTGIYRTIRGQGRAAAPSPSGVLPQEPIPSAPTVKEPTASPPKAMKEVVPETPKLYRGQPAEFKDLQKVSTTDAIDNILIGRGIFTTTDKETASTYGPNLFQFEIPSAERVFDISNATEEQLRKVMPESFFVEQRLGLYKDGPSTSGFKTYEYYRDTGKLKEAEDFLFESLVEKYLPPDVSWTEVKKGLSMDKGILPDELRDKISADLQAAGFDFVKHKGGVRAGKGEKQHDVYIALKDGVLVETDKGGKVKAVGGDPGRDPNLGSTLTPSEISDATRRQQVGRLPEDNVVPNVAGRPDVKLDIPEMNTGLRSTPMKMEELTKLGDQVADQLRPLSNEDLTKALEQLRTGALPIEESRIVARGVQMYADELQIQKAELIKQINAKPDAPNVPELQARLAALEERLAPLQMADDAFGSIAGSILRQRQEGLPGVRGITPESIMAERGVTKAEADQIWADLVGKAQVDAEIQAVAKKYDDLAAQAIEAGDYTEAARLTAQKWRELDGRVEDIAPKSASFVDKLTELAISNVFSIKTVLVNLIPSGIKTLVIPSLKALFNNPMEKATRAEFVASYSAMRSSFSGALRAGFAGWKYEQALLSRDGTRLIEGELALNDKNKWFRWAPAGAIRLFPRILNASDEFLSRLNYDSFVAGRAAANAAMEGAEKGLTGKALDDFIKKATDTAVAGARGATKGDELVQPILNKGINLGLTGEELFKYVETEALKNPDALKKGTDEEALNFVRDVLYKRNFSGEGSFSKAAQWYEEGMKKFPTLKFLIGQLFFRTPVRVFEEGIRLTPGIQFLAPNFLSDLAGKNGNLRQARAQAEAMSSLAVAGAVMSLYAQGKITGDGAYDDYRQQKLRRDGALPEPYTIKLSDGSTWSYKGFDPIATPVKIMVNALDRMDKLRIREAQGEFVDKAAYKYPLAAITVASGSIAQAIRDASLVEGADNFIKFVENAFNPEESEGSFLKFMGDKLFLLVPNTLHKIARDNDPSIRDPQTFWQMVEEKLLRPVGQDIPGVKTPFSYDVVGNVRKMSDTGSLWNVFSTASVQERMKGMNQDQVYVLQELDRLTRVTGTTFRTPTKHRDLGEMDLRTVLASDGKRTLYDVWQQIYRSMEPEKVLAPVLASPLPDGTYQHKAAKVETVQQIISQMQDAAFFEMMGSEQKVIDRMISEEIKKAKSKAGLFDTPRPY